MLLKKNVFIVLLTIVLIGAGFRLYGVNWDNAQYLHPDERFLTMVTTDLSWPGSFSEYLDTQKSPLNPNNKGYDFYVYGIIPVILVKFFSLVSKLDNYSTLYQVSRTISALFDISVIPLVYLTSRRLRLRKFVALYASLLYSIMVLPIQLAHFFAVDTFLSFFTILSFYFLIGVFQSFTQTKIYIYSVALGIAFGLAIACKINAILFLPVIGMTYLLKIYKHKNYLFMFSSILLFCTTLFIIIKLAYPYLFASGDFLSIELNQKLINSFKQLAYFSQPNNYYPPSTMWLNYPRVLFPLENMLFWGMGLPMGIFLIPSIIYTFVKYTQKTPIFLALFWVVGFFIYQATQFAQPLRYFYPIYPYLAIILSVFINNYFTFNKRWYISVIVVLFSFIWATSFVGIYSRPHSRVIASEWIYANIPHGKTLTCEYWDDCLPLNIGSGKLSSNYPTLQLSLYDPDTSTKWSSIMSDLEKVDYIVITSNRLYGSIMTVPNLYPVTNRFYTALFSQKYGFETIKEFTSRPGLPIPYLHICIPPINRRYGSVAYRHDCQFPGLSFVDDYADESFTVYDHPKVTIFKKTHDFDPLKFRDVLDIGLISL